jgi:tripartite-type tricarboxylate transporter receptor subunit TctC
MKKFLFALATAAGSFMLTACVYAQAYPAKPVRLIVPYPPGGGTDIFARTLGAKLGEAFGQQIVIENRPGAGGVIGAEVAAKAAPDGYTLLIGQASNFAINQHLMSRLPYDPVKDFAPVSLIAGSPNLLVVHPSLPVRTVKDLVALARARPGSINYASAGNGSPGHLAAEYFKKVAKIDMTHVPYKGAAPALMDVIAGHASLYLTSPIAAQPHVRSGRLRQVAVTSAQRFPPLPDVPTIAESGYPQIDVTSWWGLLVPAGVSKEIIARLHAETVKALNTAEMRERLAGQGANVMTNTPEQFAAYIKSEIAKWGRIVTESGARLD